MGKGQVSVFVIVAIILVAAIVLYFVFRDSVGQESVPESVSPVFDYYSACLEQETRNAIDIAGAQGGYIYLDNYEPGSDFAPFASHLNFLGFPVPYWYYVSGNGVVREQVPTKGDIEQEIARYVEEGARLCDFESFRASGYKVEAGEPVAQVTIKEKQVDVRVESPLTVSLGVDNAKKDNYEFNIKSEFGQMYSTARKIYEKQKSEAVFERYAVDVLRLYAPVDGVELQCAPKVWATQNVVNDLKSGLAENFITLKFDSSYYDLRDKKRSYFVIDEKVDNSVQVLYSPDWPTVVEIQGEGVDDEIMMSEVMGNKEGMGMLGFCYVPYHFVYDVRFPALVQVYNSEEMFQFPVVVIVDNNVPREAIIGETINNEEEFDLCAFKTQEVEINLFDSELNKVNGNLSFECFDQSCRLGETRNGRFSGMAPACVNGYVKVRAEGYADAKEIISTNDQAIADVILEREFEIPVNVSVSGSSVGGAITLVSFVRDDGYSSSVVLPDSSVATLSEGLYDVSVHVYGNTSIKIPATTKTQCQDVPEEGLLGFFGMTEEKCFDINIPETSLDFALLGGGKTVRFITEDELKEGKLKISVERLPRPSSIEQLQENFEKLETQPVTLEFGNGR